MTRPEFVRQPLFCPSRTVFPLDRSLSHRRLRGPSPAMRITAVLLAFVALSPLRADNTASPAATSPEEQARRMWERFNTAAIVANVDGEAITAEDIRNEL